MQTCTNVQFTDVSIIDWKTGSAGEEGGEAVCLFDSSSVALKAGELTVHTKPTAQGDHLGRRERKTL